MKQLLSLLCLLSLLACNTKKPETTNTYAPTPTGLQGIQASATAAPANATAQTQSNSDTALNPPHGQPGHRCDIAVGAPLNSPPTSLPAKSPASQQVVTPSVPTPTPEPTPAPVTAGNKKLNPKHGEPGHRCEIPVGAPLDSKPEPAAAPKAVDVKINP